VAVRRILAVAVVPAFVVCGLIGFAGQAQAATHPTAGSYRLFEPGQTPALIGTWVLEPDHLVAPYDAASWSISHNIVTVRSVGPLLPPSTCLAYGQGPDCQLTVTFSGPKTSQGIASKRSPGHFTEAANAAVISRGLFYAVWTGTAT